MASRNGATWLTIYAAVSFLIGCASDPTKTTLEQVDSYFAIQDRYSALLDRRIGGEHLLKVVPAIGAFYPIGTPLRAGTNSPITSNCAADSATPLIETLFSPLPISKGDRTFKVSANLPPQISEALQGTMDLGLKLDSSRNLELSYYGLRQVLLAEDNMHSLLRRSTCFGAIQGREITVVRGYIYGKHRINYGDTLSFRPTLKHAKLGSYDVAYNSDGSFHLDDQTERPQFMIVAWYVFPAGSSTPTKLPPNEERLRSLLVVPADRIIKSPVR